MTLIEPPNGRAKETGDGRRHHYPESRVGPCGDRAGATVCDAIDICQQPGDGMRRRHDSGKGGGKTEICVCSFMVSFPSKTYLPPHAAVSHKRDKKRAARMPPLEGVCHVWVFTMRRLKRRFSASAGKPSRQVQPSHRQTARVLSGRRAGFLGGTVILQQFLNSFGKPSASSFLEGLPPPLRVCPVSALATVCSYHGYLHRSGFQSGNHSVYI